MKQLRADKLIDELEALEPSRAHQFHTLFDTYCIGWKPSVIGVNDEFVVRRNDRISDLAVQAFVVIHGMNSNHFGTWKQEKKNFKVKVMIIRLKHRWALLVKTAENCIFIFQ